MALIKKREELMKYAIKDPVVSADFPRRIYSPEEKQILLKYMKGHLNGSVFLSPVNDFVKNEMIKDITNYCHGDSEFDWTDEEIYHILKYDAAVTDEFLQHIKNEHSLE